MPGLTLSPLPGPLPGVQRKLDASFGRVAGGVDLSNLNADDFDNIQRALYTHSLLLFPKTTLSPEKQYALTKAFDPASDSYGHGNNGRQEQSSLHPDLKTIPRQPQVQVIGNGLVESHEGLSNIRLKHPHHASFHKTRIPDVQDKEYTRFYRWHIDAALYNLSPPRVTSLYAIKVPKGRTQKIRYDDGTNDELDAPLGTTAFVSGKAMFDNLSPADKSLAVRSTVVYSPHPYVWMKDAASNAVGLGLESEGKEVPDEGLPEWEEAKVKRYPMVSHGAGLQLVGEYISSARSNPQQVWKNPETGNLHFQVHPSAIREIIIDAIPAWKTPLPDALYPQGAHLTNLQEVRRLVYNLQRPAIAPPKVYTHDWEEGDMALFHNQGVLHSVCGAFHQDEVRIFHQCNLAASTEPLPPSQDDVKKFA